MGSLSIAHWLVIALLLVLFMGPSRLASSGKGLGEGIRNFKKGLAGDDDEPEPEPEPRPKKTPKPSPKDHEEDG